MKIDAAKDFGRRECPACACEVPNTHNRCPICGYGFPHPSPAQRSLRWWGAAVMLAILLALLLGLLR